MNLLVRAMLGLRRHATADTGFAFAVVGAIVAVEVMGRHATSDLQDVWALATLAFIGFVVLTRHRRSPLPWLAPLRPISGNMLEAIKAMTYQVGLDMRGSPPVKRGTPPAIRVIVIALFVALLTFFLLSAYLPHELRVIASVSYLVYVACLGTLWLAILGMIALAVLIPFGAIHDAYVAAHRNCGERSVRREYSLVACYFGAWLLLGTFVPVWVAPMLTATLLGIYLAAVLPRGRFPVQILWRPYESIKVRSLPWRHWMARELGMIGLCALALTFFACGNMIHASQAGADSMLLTSFLGLILAWLTPGLLAVQCVQTILNRFRDPSRAAPPLLHVRDIRKIAKRGQLRRQFRAHGWKLSFAPQPPAYADATIVLVRETSPETPGSESGRGARGLGPNQWPMVVTPSELERDGLLVRLNRRAEIQRRRGFFAGLESLLKSAGCKKRDGCGYWLAPHFWFVAGLIREGSLDEASFEIGDEPIMSPLMVGLPYHRVFPRAVRKHLFDVLRAVEVDLIFIEDGVQFKRLRRVLRAIFEVYDVHAGRKPVQEIDFRGLPGTRVLIHDYQFDDTFQKAGYPEPKYDWLGRARILHVFRDRGGEDELVEPPFDFGRQPAPAGLSSQ